MHRGSCLSGCSQNKKSIESLLDHSLPHSNKYALPLHFLVQDSLEESLERRDPGVTPTVLAPTETRRANGGAREVLVTLAAQAGGKAFLRWREMSACRLGASCSL